MCHGNELPEGIHTKHRRLRRYRRPGCLISHLIAELRCFGGYKKMPRYLPARTIIALALVAAILCVAVSAVSAYPGEPALERFQVAVFDKDFNTGAPVTWNHPRIRDFLISNTRHSVEHLLVTDGARCWPASGKLICGVADSRHHLVAYTHTGCCISNGLASDTDPSLLKLPQRDLSGMHTISGIHIGSAAADVKRALGTPTVARAGHSNQSEYLYDMPIPHSCAATWIVFLLDARGRVSGIEDSMGC